MPPDCVLWCKFIFSRSLSLFSVIHMYFYLELCQSNFFPVCLYLIWRSINSCSLVFLMSWLNYSDSATSELYKEASWLAAAVAAAKSFQSCPTLWDPIDDSPPGSPIPGILQARTLEWVAISFSNAWKWKVKVKTLSRVQLLVTHGPQPTSLLYPWNFPGKSTGVGCHCLLIMAGVYSKHRSLQPDLEFLAFRTVRK